MKKIATVIILLFLIGSCKKPSAYGSEYLGTWYGIDDCLNTTLTFYEDNTADFIEHVGDGEADCNYEKYGKAEISCCFIYIGAMEFRIVKKPHFVSDSTANYQGYYEMELNKPSYLSGYVQKVTFRRYSF
ncbi:MAG TPA: hypothetical protein VG603_07025 [Chitinophagales bacterium]|nr:hypothetical protein [Chitinophagales bacterium]